MPEMSPFFPQCLHIPLTVHQARKATGLIFSWIRRNCSGNLLPASWKITTGPRTVFPAFRYIFSKEAFSPHQLSGIPYHPRAGRAESPAIRSVPEACYAPFILNCTGSKVPRRCQSRHGPKPDSLEILALQERKKKARSPKTLW